MEKENHQIFDFKDNQKPNLGLEDCLFCPSNNCLLVPELSYLYNPINSQIKFKCKCQNNYEEAKNMELKEFIKKCSNLLCQKCNKVIKDQNFSYCFNCKNIFDNSCIKIHGDNERHFSIITIDKNNIFNLCLEDRYSYIFRCIDCNISLCGKCDITSHGEHTLEQIKKCAINQKEFDHILSTFEKQKNIFKKIKDITNDIITNLENDIKLKQMVINNYQRYKNDYNSIQNLKNLFIENQEKYENIILNIFNNIENNDNNESEEQYIDKIFLPFYYSMMINGDNTLNDKSINIIKKKLNIYFNLYDNNFNDFNSTLNNNLHFLSMNNYNYNQDMIFKKSDIIQNNENFINDVNNINDINNPLNQPLLLTETKNYINFLTTSNNNIKHDIMNNNNSIPLYFPQNINSQNILDKNNPSEIKQMNNQIENIKKSEKNEKTKLENKPEKKKKIKTGYVNNMILLKSGNFFAISNKRKVEIYDLKRLNVSGKNKIFNNEAIKIRNCRIQKINPAEVPKGKFISSIFEFIDGTLLCSMYSQIIRIRLTNQDRNHIKLPPIILDKGELPRKLISLGDSLLVILSEKNKDCFIKLYSKQDESRIIANDNINTINNILSNNLLGINESNNLNINNNFSNTQKEHNFEIIERNINESKISWTTIFAIKKGLKDKNRINMGIIGSNYSSEFIATSNSNYESGAGKDKIIFYRIRKDFYGKYINSNIGEIDGISCSIEPDSICQINEQYLCIGLQNKNNPLINNGFVIIDINKKEKYKFIEGDNITGIYYDKEKSLLIAAIEKLVGTDNYYFTKIYKVIINKRNELENEILFEQKNEYQNSQNNLIVSIQKVMIDSNKNYIFATYSQDCELEVVAKEMDKLQL